MKTVQDYQNIITSEHNQKPKYMAMVTNAATTFVYLQSLLQMMIDIFDLDKMPVGDQLDILGIWAGVSRNVSIPIAGIYFSWDDQVSNGWDYGSWPPNNVPATITSLPDDAYLTLIRAKIAANNWDGTIDGAYAIWESIFPTTEILIQDNQNMTYAMAIVGAVVDSLTLALLTGGYLPLRPEGVMITEYLVAVDTGPAFAWDVPASPLLDGWDSGSWLREIPA